jgi:hypothetical protein
MCCAIEACAVLVLADRKIQDIIETVCSGGYCVDGWVEKLHKITQGKVYISLETVDHIKKMHEIDARRQKNEEKRRKKI